MGWTKGQLVDAAFDECALQGYIFNVGPEARNSALMRLDAMLALWNSKGIRMGYPLPSSPSESDVDQDSALPDWANEPVLLNLAVRIAAGFGKTLQQTTVNLASDGYLTLVARMNYPPKQQLRDGVPAGAGNKPVRTPNYSFLPPPRDPLTAGQQDTDITFE